ncbi:MAG TPA: tetratricopeptide repeat protein, partial [bacterium]|nr:tetratricopeptide repeat protein [bacterium]
MFNLKKLIYPLAFGVLTLAGPAGIAMASLPAQDPAFHFSSGNRHLENGNYQAAILEFERSLEDHPSQTKIYFNLAIAYYAEGKMSKAAGALEKLLAINPKDVEARYNLACLNLYLENPGKAKEHFLAAKADAFQSPAFIPMINQG